MLKLGKLSSCTFIRQPCLFVSLNDSFGRAESFFKISRNKFFDVWSVTQVKTQKPGLCAKFIR